MNEGSIYRVETIDNTPVAVPYANLTVQQEISHEENVDVTDYFDFPNSTSGTIKVWLTRWGRISSLCFRGSVNFNESPLESGEWAVVFTLKNLTSEDDYDLPIIKKLSTPSSAMQIGYGVAAAYFAAGGFFYHHPSEYILQIFPEHITFGNPQSYSDDLSFPSIRIYNTGSEMHGASLNPQSYMFINRFDE